MAVLPGRHNKRPLTLPTTPSNFSETFRRVVLLMSLQSRTAPTFQYLQLKELVHSLDAVVLESLPLNTAA